MIFLLPSEKRPRLSGSFCCWSPLQTFCGPPPNAFLPPSVSFSFPSNFCAPLPRLVIRSCRWVTRSRGRTYTVSAVYMAVFYGRIYGRKLYGENFHYTAFTVYTVSQPYIRFQPYIWPYLRQNHDCKHIILFQNLSFIILRGKTGKELSN